MVLLPEPMLGTQRGLSMGQPVLLKLVLLVLIWTLKAALLTVELREGGVPVHPYLVKLVQLLMVQPAAGHRGRQSPTLKSNLAIQVGKMSTAASNAGMDVDNPVIAQHTVQIDEMKTCMEQMNARIGVNHAEVSSRIEVIGAAQTAASADATDMKGMLQALCAKAGVPASS